MAEKAIKFKLFLGGTSVKAEKYLHQAIQCQKCQKFGHSVRECRSNSKCDICEVHNNICPYFTFKCASWGGNYRVNSRKCEIVKKIPKKKYSKQSFSGKHQPGRMNWEV